MANSASSQASFALLNVEIMQAIVLLLSYSSSAFIPSSSSVLTIYKSERIKS